MNLQNFTETYKTDNRFQFLAEEPVDEIIIGGTCKHVFELPFIYTDYIEFGLIIYKQNLNTIVEFIIEPSMVTIDEKAGISFISITLSPEETYNFRDTLLDTHSQLKLQTVDGEVLYTTPRKVFVKKPLN